jgi:hypothetical protein
MNANAARMADMSWPDQNPHFSRRWAMPRYMESPQNGTFPSTGSLGRPAIRSSDDPAVLRARTPYRRGGWSSWGTRP